MAKIGAYAQQGYGGSYTLYTYLYELDDSYNMNIDGGARICQWYIKDVTNGDPLNWTYFYETNIDNLTPPIKDTSAAPATYSVTLGHTYVIEVKIKNADGSIDVQIPGGVEEYKITIQSTIAPDPDTPNPTPDDPEIETADDNYAYIQARITGIISTSNATCAFYTTNGTRMPFLVQVNGVWTQVTSTTVPAGYTNSDWVRIPVGFPLTTVSFYAKVTGSYGTQNTETVSHTTQDAPIHSSMTISASRSETDPSGTIDVTLSGFGASSATDQDYITGSLRKVYWVIGHTVNRITEWKYGEDYCSNIPHGVTSFTKSFSDLEPQTTYYVYAYMRGPNGLWWYKICKTNGGAWDVTTGKDNPYGITDDTGIVVSAYYHNAVSVYLGGLTSCESDRMLLWHVNGTSSGTNYAGKDSSQSGTVTLSRLTAGEEYTVGVYIGSTNGPYYSLKVSPTGAIVGCDEEDISRTSVYAYIAGIYGIPNSSKANWFIGTTSYGTQNLGTDPYYGISAEHMIAGLNPGTTYTIEVQIDAGSYYVYPKPLEITTKPLPPVGTTDKTAIKILSIYHNSVTVRLDGFDSSYNSNRTCTWSWMVGTKPYTLTSYVAPYGTESGEVSIYDLTPGVPTEISVTVSDDNNSSSSPPFTGSVTATTAVVEYDNDDIGQISAIVYIAGLYDESLYGKRAYWAINQAEYDTSKYQYLEFSHNTGFCGPDHTISNLLPATEYLIKVRIDAGDYYVYPEPDKITTDTPTVYVGHKDVTDCSVNVRLSWVGAYAATASWYYGDNLHGEQSLPVLPDGDYSKYYEYYTLDGLDDGVTYSIYAVIEAKTSDGRSFEFKSNTISITTIATPAGTTMTTALKITDIYPDHVNVSLVNLEAPYHDNRTCIWQWKVGGVTHSGAVELDSNDAECPFIIDRLGTGRSAHVTVYVSSGLEQSNPFEIDVSATGSAVDYKRDTLTQTTAQVYITGLFDLTSESKASWRRDAALCGEQDIIYDDDQPGCTEPFTLTGLTAGTSYDISVVVTTPEYRIHPTPLKDLTTKINKLVAWDWKKKNVDASVAQTEAAYEAITSKGNLSDFSYVVWNDIVHKVNECVEATDGTWSGKSTAEMSLDDKAMTAVRFNTVCLCLKLSQSAVKVGDPIKGSYFTDLTTALNNWIKEINKGL